MTHIQTYVRCGLWLGIITFTALHTQVPACRPDYDAFAKGLHIGPPPQAAQPPNPADPSYAASGNQQTIRLER